MKRKPKKTVRPRREQGRPSRDQIGVGRAALIVSTRKLLQVKPPGKVTREEIARFAGVNPSLIRYYFGDKSALLTAVVESISKENFARMQESLSLPGTTEEKLRRRVGLLLQMHLENPYYHQLIFEELWQGNRSDQKRIGRELIVPYYDEFKRLFEEARISGELRDVEPRFLHVAMIGLCELFINAPYMLKELFRVEKLAPELMKQYGDFIVDVLLRGISTRHWEKTAPAERGTSL